MIRAGDIVKHGPTQEEWTVAVDEYNDLVYWCGYPFGGCADAKDCTVVESATDESRRKTLQDVVKTKHHYLSERARKDLEKE